MFRPKPLITVILAFICAVISQAAPAYQVQPGVFGNLTTIGSDSLNQLMQSWAEEFTRLYPGVGVQIQGVGSGSAAPALIRGTTQLAPMSRPMHRSELQSFQQRHGYLPIALLVANDALAVYVHRDNPIEAISLPQLAAIYSDSQHCGQQQAVRTWGQLGLRDSWAERIIIPYGRNSVSGTYGFFSRQALCGGDVAARVNEQPSSAAVVQAVGQQLSAIGYAGLGYQTAWVRPVPILMPNKAELYGGQAQLGEHSQPAGHTRYQAFTRPLYIYLQQDPSQRLDTLTWAFLDYILSESGQALVSRLGYLPLTNEQRRQSMALLSLARFQ